MTINTYNKGYAVLIARAIDILVCTWIWRDYDITISSMCGLELRKPTPKVWAIVIGAWILNNIEKNHCEMAILADTLRCNEALVILSNGGHV